MSATINVADRAPAAVGVNVAVIVQVADGASVAPQLLPLTAKSPGFVPPTETLVNATSVVPVFRTKTLCAELEIAMVCVPNVSPVGAMLSVVVAGIVASWLIEKLYDAPSASWTLPVSASEKRVTGKVTLNES